MAKAATNEIARTLDGSSAGEDDSARSDKVTGGRVVHADAPAEPARHPHHRQRPGLPPDALAGR